ncbi:hypothetical protein XaFJ1_GM002108 [Xanthomonas albilineans]|nr:hypothetical protein XaFJ1_GM002108 [Xanthomonas albilineans]
MKLIAMLEAEVSCASWILIQYLHLRMMLQSISL